MCTRDKQLNMKYRKYKSVEYYSYVTCILLHHYKIIELICLFRSSHRDCPVGPLSGALNHRAGGGLE